MAPRHGHSKQRGFSPPSGVQSPRSPAACAKDPDGGCPRLAWVGPGGDALAPAADTRFEQVCCSSPCGLLSQSEDAENAVVHSRDTFADSISEVATCLPGSVEEDDEEDDDTASQNDSPVELAGSAVPPFVLRDEDTLEGWVRCAKDWIAGAGRSGERELMEAFEELEQELERGARGHVVGPRQRRLLLEHELHREDDWQTAAQELSATWGLDSEQTERLKACQLHEGCCMQSQVSGSVVNARFARYRTRRDGLAIHVVHGCCELEWDVVAPEGTPREILWESFGGDLRNAAPCALVRLERQVHCDYHTARAGVGVCRGVLEWEVVPHGRCSGIYVGVCTGAMPLQELVRDEGCLCLHSQGYLHRGLSGQPSLMLEPFQVGDVLRFRLDMDSGTLELRKNGAPLADAQNLPRRLGPIYPYVTLDHTGEGCSIRVAEPQLAAGALDRMLAYTGRLAEHRLSTRLRLPDGGVAS